MKNVKASSVAKHALLVREAWVRLTTSQIGHSVVKGTPPLRRFFEAVLPGAKPRTRR